MFIFWIVLLNRTKEEEHMKEESFFLCLAGTLCKKTEQSWSLEVGVPQDDPGRLHGRLQEHCQPELAAPLRLLKDYLDRKFLLSFKTNRKIKAEQEVMWRGHSGWWGWGRKKGLRAVEVSKALTVQRNYSCHLSSSCSLQWGCQASRIYINMHKSP